MIGHFILKCTECGRTITQCRCMEPDKELRWAVCMECEQKRRKEQTVSQ